MVSTSSSILEVVYIYHTTYEEVPLPPVARRATGRCGTAFLNRSRSSAFTDLGPSFFGPAKNQIKHATGRWGACTSRCAAAIGGKFYIEIELAFCGGKFYIIEIELAFIIILFVRHHTPQFTYTINVRT